MAARLDSVSRYICIAGDWNVTNLKLQKLLYMAQMIYMGENEGEKLVDTSFEAWDYGPVSPRLYRKVRTFGSKPIEDVFDQARSFAPDDPRRAVLDEVCRDLLPLTAGQLVEMTHWANGAWAKHYVAGSGGIPIPDRDIYREYRERIAA